MNTQPHVLVVGDDPAITQRVITCLHRHGMTVSVAGDAAAMDELLAREPVDLVVLDLGLPDTHGLALLRRLRAVSALPVVVLIARASSYDRIVGFESGADDCITKPLDPVEFAARVQRVLRRAQADRTQPRGLSGAGVVRFDGWQLHRTQRYLQTPEGAMLPLSNAECRLLDALLACPRAVVTRDQLFDQARGRASAPPDGSLERLIARLRHKLGGAQAVGAPLIKTVRGMGYMLDARQVEPVPGLH